MPHCLCRGVDQGRAVVDRVDLHAAGKKAAVQRSNLGPHAFESGQGLLPALQQDGGFDDVAIAVSAHSAERRRSEERRVGKECRSRWAREEYKEKSRNRM